MAGLGGHQKGLLGELHRRLSVRMMNTLAESSQKKLKSALTSFNEFAERIPGRELFTDNVLHNEWTFMLYLEYLAEHKSKVTLKPVKTGTAAGYVSMLRAHFAREYGFELTRGTERLKQLLKNLRRNENDEGRRKRRALRRHHLVQAYQQVGWYRREDSESTVWAAALACSTLVFLARNIELLNGESFLHAVLDGQQPRTVAVAHRRSRGAASAGARAPCSFAPTVDP